MNDLDVDGFAALPGLLTQQQAAELLDVSRQHVDQLANSGELKRVRFGHSRAFITRLSLQQHIDRRAWPTPFDDPDLRKQLGIKPARRDGANYGRMPNKDRLEIVMTLMSIGVFTSRQNRRLRDALKHRPYWRASSIDLYFPDDAATP